MQVWRISKKAYALDRVGTGAERTGGRWNSVGNVVIYAGMSVAITSMEKLVHTGNILPTDLVLVKLTLPDDGSLYQTETGSTLPQDWDAMPGSVAAVAVGDEFILSNTHLGLIIPSSVVPEENNIVINPKHPEYHKVTMEIVREFQFDGRLRSK